MPASPTATYPCLEALGDTALSIEFGAAIDPESEARVLGLDGAIADAMSAGRFPAIVECVPTFRSLTVHFDPDADGADTLGADLLALARSTPPRHAAGRCWRIPVCFDREFAPDLDALAAARGLGPARVIELLTTTAFRCCMLGFLPGFAYLRGLPEACALPRRTTPRLRVPERSLAVADRLCAVYPWASPGGWHLLGRTPVRLFDADDSARPALLAAGDEILWQAIDRAAYDALDALAAAGRLPRDSLWVIQ